MSSLRISRDAHGFAFDGNAQPVSRVPSGTTLTFETYDCFSNKISSPEQVFHRDEDVLALIGSYNPVTGPVFVTGAVPGDYLRVRIDAIELGTLEPFAVMVVTADGKGVCGRPSGLLPVVPSTVICPIESDAVIFPSSQGDLRLPVRSMVGSIGLAPPSGRASSLEFGPEHGGNMDCPDLTVGATILLPVNVEGGLLSLGDVHAAMGDAEVTGTALETSGDVTVTIDVVPGKPGGRHLPRLDNDSQIGSIGCEFGAGVEGNLHLAFADLIERLVFEYGLTPIEAYQLAGAGARVTINQCVAGGWSATRVAMPRDHLPPRIR